MTTNLEFSKWVNVFYDEQMAAAMIDGLVHDGYPMLFDDQSYRIKNPLIREHS
jgi:DNA replication protein DnaC